MRLHYSLTAATVALALGACSSKPAEAPMDTATTPTVMESTEAAPAMTATPTTAMSAEDFVKTAAASDRFEIESSKLAETMSKSGAVKDFARMMITAHTKSTADLKAAAAKLSPAIAVMPELNPEQTADLDALKAAGADFDKVYAQKQVAGHQKTLSAMQDYAANGTATPLKMFAQHTAPIVSGHLDKAKQLPM
jgi:putative membrane protein